MNQYAIESLFGMEGLNIAWYGIIIVCGTLGIVILFIIRKRQAVRQ